MNNQRILPFTVLIFLFLHSALITNAQETPPYRKNVFAFNITRMITSEANISYERFISIRKSLEFNVGIIYVNSVLEDQADDWNISPVFSEHGYAARFHIKTFRRQEDNSKWRDYMAPGLVFKHSYFDVQNIDDTEIKSDFVNTDSVPFEFTYTEKFLRSRNRNRFGVEFIWGKVYDASRTFAFEYYYGAGLMFTMSSHTDYSREAIYRTPSPGYDSNGDRIPTPANKPIPNYTVEDFYVRPVIQLGFKLRLKL